MLKKKRDQNQSTENRKKEKKNSNVYSLYPRKLKMQISIIFLVIIAFYLYSLDQTGSDFTQFFIKLWDGLDRLFGMFPPNWAYMEYALDPLIETVQIAIVATTFSVLICIPASLLAANTVTTNKYLYQFTRTVLNILRTIPDILLATIFVSLFGIGIIPGIMALTVFSLGLLAKLLSESIETIDPKQLDAVKATGGNIFQVIWYGVVPQALPQFISYGLYVFELNVRASLVLGFVGAGGIGSIIETELNFMAYENVMAILIVLLVAVILIETVSNILRRRVV